MTQTRLQRIAQLFTYGCGVGILACLLCSLISYFFFKQTNIKDIVSNLNYAGIACWVIAGAFVSSGSQLDAAEAENRAKWGEVTQKQGFPLASILVMLVAGSFCFVALALGKAILGQ